MKVIMNIKISLIFKNRIKLNLRQKKILRIKISIKNKAFKFQI